MNEKQSRKSAEEIAESMEIKGFLNALFWSGCIWVIVFLAITDWIF